jgi:hypothetical protein
MVAFSRSIRPIRNHGIGRPWRRVLTNEQELRQPGPSCHMKKTAIFSTETTTFMIPAEAMILK